MLPLRSIDVNRVVPSKFESPQAREIIDNYTHGDLINERKNVL